MALMPGAVYRRLYEGANHRLRSFASGRFAHRCRPVSISFLLTELCNARCVHCDIWKNKGKEDSPSASQWKQVLDDLRSWLGPVSIVFTGGEALLKPYSIELAAHASSRGFCLEFLTHGYWKDQARIEQLALARPSQITISVDGVGAVHSKIRGREDFFEHTDRTIETLVRVRSQHKLGYRILLKTVIMEQNLDALGEVARYANRDGSGGFLPADRAELQYRRRPHLVSDQSHLAPRPRGGRPGGPPTDRAQALRAAYRQQRRALRIDDPLFSGSSRPAAAYPGARRPTEEAALRRPDDAPVAEQRRCHHLQSPASRRKYQGFGRPPDLGTAHTILGTRMLSRRQRHG